MNFIINGKDEGKHHFMPGTTIGGLKERFRADDAGTIIVSMTFNNGETLAPEVWTTDRYDNVTLDYYYNNNLLDGGRIVLTRPIALMAQQYRQHNDITVLREMVYGHVVRTIDEPSHEAIVRLRRFPEFSAEFPTYNEYLRKQRQYIDNSSMDNLKFYATLANKFAEIETMAYMDMEHVETGMPPGGFFLMEGGKIVQVADR